MKPHRSRILPLVVGALTMALTVQLGNWQLHRAAGKAALQARLDAFDVATPIVAHGGDSALEEWRPVRLDGHWRAQATIFLDNRTRAGRAGYHVLTPLQLDDGSGWVLVNRGWIAADADRSHLPYVATADDAQQHIEGRLRHVETNPFTLGDASAIRQGRVWQVVDLARYRESTGLTVTPWLVQQTSTAADGLERDWPRPDAGIDRHRGYAFQWYALAALAAGLSCWYGWKEFAWRMRGERPVH